MTTFERALEKICEYVELDKSAINEETTFETMKIDSLDMVEIIMGLEEEFNVNIDDASEFKTIGDVVAYIEGINS